MGYVLLACTYDTHLRLFLGPNEGFSEHEYVAIQMRSGLDLTQNRNQPAKPYVPFLVSCLQSKSCRAFQGDVVV